MRRDLSTCSRQSAMHHGVRGVRVFFRRSSEHHTQQKRQQKLHQHILESRRTCFFLIFVFVTFLRVLYNNIHHVNQRSKLLVHTCSAEVPVLHTPVEVRFSMTCRFVHGQGKRGNVHIPAIMSVAFADVVVFDGFI